MRNTCTIASLLFALTLSPLLSAALAQDDDADWYAHKGYTVEEVLSTSPSQYVVVMHTPEGSYQLLTPSSPSNGLLQIVAVGSSQVRLREQDQPVPILLPIKHANIPLDVLVVASCVLQGKNVIVAGVPSEVVSDLRPSPTSYREELMDELEPQGCGLLVYDEVALAGCGAATQFPKQFNGATSGVAPFQIHALRITLGDAVAQLEQAFGGAELIFEGDASVPISLFIDRMPPMAVLYYINGLTDANIRVKKPPKPAPVTTAPTSPTASANLSPKKAARVFGRVRTLAAAGRTKDAGSLLLRLIKRSKPTPGYYNALAKLYWKLGAKTKAVKALKHTLRADPSNAYARRTLRNIKKTL